MRCVKMADDSTGSPVPRSINGPSYIIRPPLYSSSYIKTPPSIMSNSSILSTDDREGLRHSKLPQYTSTLSNTSPKSSLSMKEGSVSTKSSEERREWLSKQRILQEELLGVQEECRRLRVQVEQRTNRLSEEERPLSSLSYRGNHQPILRRAPLLNNTLSHSNTSLSSITHTKGGSYSSAYSSSLLEGPSNAVELEKAKIKIRKLEKEVSVIEGQLVNKTKQAETHVEELTQLRSLLSQEKASHAIALHQGQEKTANELGRLKAVHSTQLTELQSQLEHYRKGNVKSEECIAKLKTELKGSQSEVKVLSDNVSKLVKQLEEERETHQLSMERVQCEVTDGQRKVTELKRDLKSYQQQLSNCMNEIQVDTNGKEREIHQLQREVELLSTQLHECKDELIKGNHVIRQLQGELDTVTEQLRERESEGQRTIDKHRRQIEDYELTKRKLLDKLEKTNKELSTVSDRVMSLQQSSLVAHQLEGEITELRKSLAEQQKQRQETERGKEMTERQLEKVKSERNDLKTRLQQCTQQLAEMQQRSEEWRGERETLNNRLKEIHGLLNSKEREIQTLKDQIKDNNMKNKDSQSSITNMQEELSKRAQQVMQLDSALRKHQAETATKTLQLERTLAQRQSDLRTQTNDMELLSKRYAAANRTIKELQEQLDKPHPHNMSLKEEKRLLERELEQCRQRETVAKQQLHQMTQNYHKMEQKIHLEGNTHLVKSLKEEIVQLEAQHKMGQEEVARCRAQVASLSAELSVERQLLEETREELAKTKTASLVPSTSLPSTASLLPSSHPLIIPTLSFKEDTSSSIVSDVQYPQLPNSKSLKPSTNIIHI